MDEKKEVFMVIDKSQVASSSSIKVAENEDHVTSYIYKYVS